MAVPARYGALVDRAVASAKRAGHERVTVLHLAAALLDRDESRYEKLLGPDQARAVRDAVRPSGSVVSHLDLEPVHGLLSELGDRDLDEVLREYLANELTELQPLSNGSDGRDTAAVSGRARSDPSVEADRSAAETPAKEPQRSLPGVLGAVAAVIEGVAEDAVIGRDREVEAIITALGRRDPIAPVIIGPSGSGRSSVVRHLASHLSSGSYHGPLAGTTVIAVDPTAVIAKDRAGTLRSVIEAARNLEDAILVLDDVELLGGLGWGQSVDLGSLAIIRGAVGRHDLRLLLVLDERFRADLEVHDRELAAELLPIELPPLDDTTLLQIGRDAGQRLGTYHGATVPEPVVAVAASPAPNGGTRQHPALLVERLDAACVRAAMQSRDEIEVADLDLPADADALGTAELEEHLLNRIVGQDVAVERVVGRLALTRSQMDLRPERPDGVFLFVGPTGVGKTAFAVELATSLAGARDALVRLDMSEYVHESSINRLVGPAPGYVGSTEPSQWLTTRVREQPDAVILLDEIEKAHPRVWNTFLQVFDGGRLTDGRGTEADFSRAVIILTSNLGAAEAARPALGFTGGAGGQERARQGLVDAVRAAFPPELFNRLDDVIVFDALSPQAIHEIASREVGQMLSRLARRGIVMELGPGVIDHLAETGYDPAFGARHLHRNIETLLLQPAARLPAGRYRVEVADNAFDMIPA